MKQRASGKRRTPAQVKSDEQYRADAIEHAEKIMLTHTDHVHYNGVCMVGDPAPQCGPRMVLIHDPRPYTAREHKLAYMLKRVAALRPKPRARGAGCRKAKK